MKWIAPLSFILIALTACTTILFVSALKPASTSAFVLFAAWLILPHVIICAALMILQRKGKASFHWYAVAVMVSMGGVLLLVDVIFWHRDAQGALSVLMTPILQVAALALLLPVAWWISRNART